MRILPLLVRSALSVVVASVVGSLVFAADVTSPTGTWAPSGAMTAVRPDAAAVLLYDGRVLVTGGSSDGGPLRTTDLFTPGAAFSASAPMVSARRGHAAVALYDGRVLVIGGITEDGVAVNSAEIYDPWFDEWHTI